MRVSTLEAENRLSAGGAGAAVAKRGVPVAKPVPAALPHGVAQGLRALAAKAAGGHRQAKGLPPATGGEVAAWKGEGRR